MHAVLCRCVDVLTLDCCGVPASCGARGLLSASQSPRGDARLVCPDLWSCGLLGLVVVVCPDLWSCGLLGLVVVSCGAVLALIASSIAASSSRRRARATSLKQVLAKSGQCTAILSTFCSSLSGTINVPSVLLVAVLVLAVCPTEAVVEVVGR